MKKSQFWRILFHTDTFMLALAIFLLWLTITLFYDEFTSFQSLRKHAGVIKKSEFVITKIKNKPFFKDTTREMRLFLDDNRGYYSITTSKTLPEFDNLFWGDTVNLYTKNKWLGLFGFSETGLSTLSGFQTGRCFLTTKRTRNPEGDYIY